MTVSQKTVLIVEDEQMLLSALQRKLESAGLNVLTAKDGSEGLKLALENRPDLILLDIILPLMDGITFLERLRRDEWGKQVPVIVLSNLSKASTITETKEKGVKMFLVKTDWKIDDVLQKIKNELGTQ
jgi:two-component system phosphate regulon response regulator PhoB